MVDNQSKQTDNLNLLTPVRSNNLLPSQMFTYTHPVHIFTHPEAYSPILAAVMTQLTKKGIKTQLHAHPSHLQTLIKKSSQQKIFVIINTLKSTKDVFPQKYTFPKVKELNKIKILTLPNKLPKTQFVNCTSSIDIITAYQKFFLINESSKIKLRKVNSSKDVKYQLVSPQKLVSIKKSPKQIFFQKLFLNDYKVNPDSEFKVLIDSIKTLPNTQIIMNFAELKKSVQNMKEINNSKVLLLVEEKMLKEYRQNIDKYKISQRVQMIVFGDLRPNKQLLKENVYFASDNADLILNQLEKIKFENMNLCRSEYLKLSSTRKNQFQFSASSLKVMPSANGNNNNSPVLIGNKSPSIQNGRNQTTPKKLHQKPELYRFSQRSGASLYSNNSSQFDRYVRTWIVDLDPKETNKKIAQYLTLQEGRQQIQGPSEPVSKRASRITAMRRHSSESSESNFVSKLNHLSEDTLKLKKGQGLSSSNVNITMPQNFQVHKMHSSQKQVPARQSPVIVNQNSEQLERAQSPPETRKVLTITKKNPNENTNQHKTKHQQIPNSVIQQMSEQYRGSNRDSIMNMEDYFNTNGKEGFTVYSGNEGRSQLVGNFSKFKKEQSQQMQQSEKKDKKELTDENNRMTVSSAGQIINNTEKNISNLSNTNKQVVSMSQKIMTNNGGFITSKPQSKDKIGSHESLKDVEGSHLKNMEGNNMEQTMVKQRLIDGLTGQLIGSYGNLSNNINDNIMLHSDNNNIETNQQSIKVNQQSSSSKSVGNFEKKIFETITVMPYQPGQFKGSSYQSRNYENEQQQSKQQIMGSRENVELSKSYKMIGGNSNKQLPQWSGSAQLNKQKAQQLGYERRTKQNLGQQVILVKDLQKMLIIDGKTGQLQRQSQDRLNSIRVKSIQINQQNQPFQGKDKESGIRQQYQVVRQMKGIEPQIVKMQSLEWSIDNDNLSIRESLPTQRKINVNLYNRGENSNSNDNNSNTNNNNYNSINTKKVNSTTSINEEISVSTSNNNIQYKNPRELGYNNNKVNSKETVEKGDNSIEGKYNIEANHKSPNRYSRVERILSPTVATLNYPEHRTSTYSPEHKYTTDTITMHKPVVATSSSNYKVYTPEEYAAKYGTEAANNLLGSNVKKDLNTYSNYASQPNYTQSTAQHYHTSSSNNNTGYHPYTKYGSSSYQTSVKQPQTINKVQIKASDLPEHNGNKMTVSVSNSNGISQGYNTPAYSNSYKYTKRMSTTAPNQQYYQYSAPNVEVHSVYTYEKYPTKSNPDEDPFNQKQSKHSKGSYMKRKQDGKRDPFSPYEQTGSYIQKESTITKQKSPSRIYTNNKKNHLSPPGSIIKYTSQALQKYQKPDENPINLYKIKDQNAQSNQRVTIIKTESRTIIEPPIRDNYHRQSSKVITGSGVTRYEPSGKNYANSPTRRQGSSYEKGLVSQNPLRRPTHEHVVAPLKEQNIKPLVYDPRSPMRVSQYKSLQPQKQMKTYTYASPTRHVYERKQIVQPRVQKSYFNARITDDYQNKTNQKEKEKAQIKKGTNIPSDQQLGHISRIHTRNSEIFQLSDGSIMRRNNIKFGINKHRADTQANNINNHENSLQYLDDIKSQIQFSRIKNSQIKEGQLYTLEKKYSTEKEILNEKESFSYINTNVNEFYFLIDDDLPHISLWITKYLKTVNDTIDKYQGMEQLYDKLKTQKQRRSYDVTFIFAKKEDLLKINKKTLYEDCYIIEILGQQFKGLEISQGEHKIKLSKLPHLKMVQKVIVETMLTHVILYQKTSKNDQSTESYFSKEIAHILSLFPEGHFIKEPYNSPLTAKQIVSLIDDPKFTRIYIICNEKEMTHISAQVQFASTQSIIPQQIFKLICIPSDNQILKYESKIESHPKVAWMTNASKIVDYKSLIKYALRQQQDDLLYNGKTENQQKQKLFYHIRHKNLVPIIEKQFPSRFQFDSYASMNEVQRKIAKSKADLKSKQSITKVKQSMSPLIKRLSTQNKSRTVISQNQNIVNYLILHPVSSDQFVDTKLFKKVFLLGKSEKTQRKVVKVSTNQELLQLLKK